MTAPPRPSAGRADRHATELAFATGLAIRAGELLVERFEKVEHIDYKSAKDVVTEVDRLSEELIIGAIRDAYPGDGIIAEESGEHASGAGEAPTGGVGRAWVIDPLDGTINYANGIPFFCVAIALVEAGQPVVGVIHDPMRGETFAATADGPATLAGRPIRASVKTAVTDYVVSMALSGRALIGRSRAVRKAVRVPRCDGLRCTLARLRGQRPVRRVRPAGWPVDLGRGSGGARRRARRRPPHGPRGRALVRSLPADAHDRRPRRAARAPRRAARAGPPRRGSAELTTSLPAGCLACDATAGRLQPPGGTIVEESGWLLEHALSPVPLRGWLILKPRRHVEHLAELEEGEAAALGPLISKVSAAMMSALGAERIYVASFGEIVRHVHIYFVPRYPDMPPIGPAILVQMGSGNSPWACDDEAAADAASRVRHALLAGT